MELPGVTISWSHNPLRTVVTLDDLGVMRLKYALALEGLEDAAIVHKLALEKPDEWQKWIGNFDYAGYESAEAIGKRIDEMVRWMREELQGSHNGDCTCCPMTCMKCYAEGLLGIDTTKGLSKYAGNNIDKAFRSDATIADAIAWLRDTPITATWAGWEAHLPRWTQERNDAIAWLTAYKAEHFSGQ